MDTHTCMHTCIHTPIYVYTLSLLSPRRVHAFTPFPLPTWKPHTNTSTVKSSSTKRASPVAPQPLGAQVFVIDDDEEEAVDIDECTGKVVTTPTAHEKTTHLGASAKSNALKKRQSAPLRSNLGSNSGIGCGHATSGDIGNGIKYYQGERVGAAVDDTAITTYIDGDVGHVTKHRQDDGAKAIIDNTGNTTHISGDHVDGEEDNDDNGDEDDMGVAAKAGAARAVSMPSRASRVSAQGDNDVIEQGIEMHKARALTRSVSAPVSQHHRSRRHAPSAVREIFHSPAKCQHSLCSKPPLPGIAHCIKHVHLDSNW